MERKCYRCQVLKPITEFSTATKKRLGRSYRCKDCDRIMYRERRIKNIDTHKRKYKVYYEKHKEEILEKRKAYNHQNKDKQSARSKLIHAVYAGKIVRPDHCSECGKEGKPDAHHDDYSKPLDVRWLCRKCHAIHHHGK